MAGIARIVGTKDVEAALVQAFKEWTEDVNNIYWRERFEKKYPYEGEPTTRKNGEVVDDPRNILDTEALYESGVESYEYRAEVNGARADWHWDAKNSSGEEYAWFVHEGKGPYSREPRRWTDEMASEYLFETSNVKRDLMSKIESKLND